MGCGASKEGTADGGEQKMSPLKEKDDAEDEMPQEREGAASGGDEGGLEKQAVEGGPGGGAAKKPRGRRTSVSAEPVDMAKLKLEKTRVIPKNEDEKKEILAAVKNNFLFTGLGKAELEIVINAVEKRKHLPGDTVIRQGDDGNEFFVLGSGECECFLDLKNGKDPIMVKTYRAGESFGELALMYMTPRAATIKAKTDVICWVMDRLTFRKVVMTSAAAKREKYEGFLDRVSLLNSLDKYERASIADALKETVYKKGEYIIREGDTKDQSFYILEFGSAVATKVLAGKGPDPVEVMRYQPGDYFGELALITSNPRAANVVAADDNCVVVSLDKDSFTRVLGPCINILKRDADNYSAIEARLKGAKLDTAEDVKKDSDDIV